MPEENAELKFVQNIGKLVNTNWKVGYNEGWRDSLISLGDTFTKLNKELGGGSIEITELISICEQFLTKVLADVDQAKQELYDLAPELQALDKRTLN